MRHVEVLNRPLNEFLPPGVISGFEHVLIVSEFRLRLTFMMVVLISSVSLRIRDSALSFELSSCFIVIPVVNSVSAVLVQKII